MVKRKVVILVTVLVLIFTAGVFAKDKLEISGTLDSSIEGISDDGELIDREKVDLELKKNFGFDADMYIDLATYSKKNEDTEVELNEVYLNYYTDSMDWRIGKQIINWGSSYKLQPTNYFTSYDYTALKPLDEKKGIKAVNGKYYTTNGLEITGVITPCFEGNKLSTEQTKIVQQVEDDIENIQGGFKITKRAFRGFDLSASMYHGFDKRYIKNNQGEYIYPEVNKIGLDIIGDIRDIGVWTELVCGSYRDEEFDDCLEGTIGMDYKFANDLYLVGQVYYQGGRSESENEVKMINFHVDKPVFKFHEIEGKVIYEFETETFLFEPQFNYSLTNSTELQIGGTYVDSDNKDNPSGSTLGQDRVYTRLKIEF